MRFRPYNRRPYGSTHAVVSDLLDEAGGVKKAAFLIGRTESQTLAYSDPAGDSHINLDMVRRLVMATGATAPAEDLAALAGGYFQPGKVEEREFPELVALTSAEWGAFCGMVIRALTDNRIDALERETCLRAMDVVIKAMVSARSKLLAVAVAA